MSTPIKNIKNEILIESEKLFTLKGVKNTSLADIAKATSISKGTLYYYYPLKSDIIFEIADNHMSKIVLEILNWVKNIPKNTPINEIILSIFNKIINAKTRSTLHIHLLSASLISNKTLLDKVSSKYNEWISEVQNGLRILSVDSDFDHVVVSQMIVALLDGYVIQNILGLSKPQLKKTSDLVSKIIT